MPSALYVTKGEFVYTVCQLYDSNGVLDKSVCSVGRSGGDVVGVYGRCRRRRWRLSTSPARRR